MIEESSGELGAAPLYSLLAAMLHKCVRLLALRLLIVL
jgi:hypothetical protein